MKRRKSSAAAEMARKRWKGTSREQRSEAMRRVAEARWAKPRAAKEQQP